MNIPLGISCINVWNSKLYNNKESRELNQITFFDNNELYIPANHCIMGISFFYEPVIMEKMYFGKFGRIIGESVIEIKSRKGKKVYYKGTLTDVMSSIFPKIWGGGCAFEISGTRGFFPPIKTTRQAKIVLCLKEYKELQEGVKFGFSLFIKKYKKSNDILGEKVPMSQHGIVIKQKGGGG